MTNEGVVKAFLNKIPGHSNSLASTGSSFVSYTQPIAWWVRGKGLLIDCSKMPSVTTSLHRGLLISSAKYAGQKYKCGKPKTSA